MAIITVYSFWKWPGANFDPIQLPLIYLRVWGRRERPLQGGFIECSADQGYDKGSAIASDEILVLYFLMHKNSARLISTITHFSKIAAVSLYIHIQYSAPTTREMWLKTHLTLGKVIVTI